MSTFYSRYNPAPNPAQQAGSREKQLYRIKITPSGHKNIVPDGKTNIYEKIQAGLKQTQIYEIMKKHEVKHPGELPGDELTKKIGNFGDITYLPTSMAEAQQKIIEAGEIWNELPLDTRKKFDNDINLFLASADNGSLLKKIGISIESTTPPKETQQQGTEAVKTPIEGGNK